MASGVLAIVVSLLATEREEDERRELVALVKEVQKTSDTRLSWLQWLQQGPPMLLDRWVLYAFIRAFAPTGATVEGMLKADAVTTAASIEALSRPFADPQSIVKLLNEAAWSTQSLRTVSSIVQQIEDPRVRQQILQLMFAAIARSSPEASVHWIQAATEVLVLGVTDVWSAIRKESARDASTIVFQFQSLDQIDSFIESLLKIAMSEPWKAQEGALLTLRAMLSAITVDRAAPSTLAAGTSKASGSTAAEMVKGVAVSPTSTVYHLGERHRGIPQLPRSLAFKLKPTLYMALKHAQVSVREAAAQSLAFYVEICDESTRILTFQEVMSKLNRLSVPAEQGTSGVTEPSNQAHAELLDAAEAEGLLDVLGKLVPHLPVQFLVKHWKLVFPTLERYVMHIASSVRLRSSAVVLALAELAQRDSSNSSAAYELLYQMLVALADHRADVGVCWQRLEGRLLSVDLLVGLLGRDHLWRRSADSGLLQILSAPRKTSSDSWLPDTMASQATWTVDEEEEARLKRVIRAKSPSPSIIDSLNAHVVGKKRSSEEMWQRVLSGWLSQTRAAFESRQFELRRIARQALPGLVRLAGWCGQLSLLTGTAAASSSADSKATTCATLDGWKWSCLRHALLHAELLRKCGAGDKQLEEVVSRVHAFTTTQLAPARSHDATSALAEEPEAVVARVEAVVMASLTLAQTNGVVPAIEAELHRAFLDVHASLPEAYHHPSVLGCSSASSDASLDRQFSIAIVQLLPTIVKCTTLLRDRDSKLWCMVVRIALSWLATDDMFRWITIDKQSAQASLLQTLDELLALSPSQALGRDDAAFVVRTVESAVVTSQLKDAAVRCLVRVYASLWSCVMSDPSTRVAVKILKNLALLDSQRRSSQSAKALASQPAKNEWDDWDGEGEEDTVAVAEKLEELRPLSSLDESNPKSPVVSELIRTLQPPQLDALQSSLDQLISSEEKSVASCRQALQSLSVSLVGH